MTPVSLMPSVDYCPSCEGQKAETKAFDIASNRARQDELKAVSEPATSAPDSPPPGAPLPAGTGRTEPVGGSTPTLLSPDLAVQASLARPEIDAGSGAAEALRLRTAEAYRSLQSFSR